MCMPLWCFCFVVAIFSFYVRSCDTLTISFRIAALAPGQSKAIDKEMSLNMFIEPTICKSYIYSLLSECVVSHHDFPGIS